MNKNDVKAYELLQTKELKGIHSVGYLLRHKKSGARVLLIENDDDNKVFSDRISYTTVGQHRCTTYYGTFCIVRIEEFPGKRSICRTGKRIIEYISECDDISGQDRISSRKLQRQRLSEPDAYLYGCCALSEYL